MSTFAEKHDILRVAGFNGGMICLHFEGELTAPVERTPQMVVILDEIDKMHLDAWPMLMQLREEGILVDGAGRIVSFADTVLFLTTRVGHEEGLASENERMRATLQRAFLPDTLRLLHDILLLRGSRSL